MTVEELLKMIEKLEKRITVLEAENERLRAENEMLRAENTALKKKNAELERTIERLKGKNKKYVAPFGGSTPKPDPKPSGRKAGEGKFSYKSAPEKEDITEVIEVAEPDVCTCCGADLNMAETHFDKAYITDVPIQIKPQVTEYVLPVKQCPNCQQKVRASHPDIAQDQRGASAHRYGKNLAALTTYLRFARNLSEHNTCKIIKDLFGISITQGGFNQSIRRFAEAHSVLAEQISLFKSQIRNAPFVHHDNTGWHLSGRLAWVGVFTSSDTALFTVAGKHTHAEVLDVLGTDFSGVLISDRYNIYDHHNLAAYAQQKCLAHVARNIEDVCLATEGKVGRSAEFALNLKDLVTQTLNFHHTIQVNGCVDPYTLGRLTREWNKKLNRPAMKLKENEGLRSGLWKQHSQGKLLACVEQVGIPATNNQAERCLRNVVIGRKISQCSKSLEGANAYMAFKSFVSTAHLRELNPLAALQALLSRYPPL